MRLDSKIRNRVSFEALRRLGTDEVCDKTTPDLRTSAPQSPALARTATPNRVHSALKSAHKASYTGEIAAFNGRDTKTMRCEDKSPRQARMLLQIYGAGIKFCFQNRALKARAPPCGLNPPQARTARKRHKILPRPRRSNRVTPQA